MILRYCMPIVVKARTGIRNKRIISILRTWIKNPVIIRKIATVWINYSSAAKIYCDLWRFKNTVSLLRFRYKGEKDNNEYDTKLLQVLCTLLKTTIKR